MVPFRKDSEAVPEWLYLGGACLYSQWQPPGSLQLASILVIDIFLGPPLLLLLPASCPSVLRVHVYPALPE